MQPAPGARGRRFQIAGVFVAAFLALSFNLWRTGTASGWTDPLLHYGSQDEAAYTHEAIGMLIHGDWLTPDILGRWVLEKPPLLVWLSAGAMRIFGIGVFAPRVPAAIGGALVAALCFGIAWTARSALAGFTVVLLCVFSPLLFTMSRLDMTDMPLTAAIVISLAALIHDPALSRRTSKIAFTGAITAGILFKSVAGLLPAGAAILAAFIAVPLLARPRKVVLLTAIGIACASPWFLFQFIAHRQWFLADIGFQLVTVGLGTQQATAQNHVSFYLIRLLYAAPAAAALAITGLPRCFAELRRRNFMAVVPACYFVVISAALLLFRFESEPYLTPLIPILILIAALFSPLLEGRFTAPLAAALAILCFIKIANPGRAWGISYRPGATVALAAPLSAYCRERRGNDLYILGLDDQLYALALPLERVRYGWIDPLGAIAAARPHLAYLGIVQPVGNPSGSALYAARLRAWGLNSTAPVATGLTARDAAELATLVIAHPESDFLVSREIASHVPAQDPHTLRRIGKNYLLLESHTALPAAPPRWTCRM